MSYRELNSRELYEGIKNYDPKTFDYIYQHLGPDVISWVAQNGGTTHDGKDVLQNTLFQIIKSICVNNTYTETGRFVHFFRTIAIKTWYKRVSKQNRRVEHHAASVSEELQIADTSDADIAFKLSKEQEIIQLEQAIETLEEPARTIVKLRAKGTSIAEIAVQCGRSAKAVKQLLYRNRQKLKIVLEKQRITLDNIVVVG